MTATDGKKRLTDAAYTQQLLRIIQSIPSPKAKPMKMWLAEVGRERINEDILNAVYEKINTAEIWIPFGEARKYFYSPKNKFKKRYEKQISNSKE